MLERTPILKELNGISYAEDSATLEKFGKYFTISGDGEMLRSIFERFDGRTSISDVSREISVPESDISHLVDQLYSQNLVGFPDDERSFSGKEFWSLHNNYCRDWLDRIAAHRIWPALTEGRASRAVAIGFVIEKFHYIEGAYEHMALAAANADARIGTELTKHFIEEYTHGDIYLGGLSSLFPKQAVVESLPLPSTRALLNCLNELAQSDSVAYYSANEFLQKTENIGDGLEDPVENFYQAFEKNYDLPPMVCRAMRAHTEQDQELGHDDVFARMCDNLGVVSHDQANRYLRATKEIVEHLEFFLDGILTYYNTFPIVPRPPSSLTGD